MWRVLHCRRRFALKTALVFLVINIGILILLDFWIVIPSKAIKGSNPLKNEEKMEAFHTNPEQDNILHESLAKNNRTSSKVLNRSNADMSTPVQPALLTSMSALTQSVLDSIAANMVVRFEVLNNFEKAVISLRNGGRTKIERNRWAMYICLFRGMEHDQLAHNPRGYVLPGAKSIKVTHMNGCAYKIEPTKDFQTIFPDKSLEFMVRIGNTDVKSEVSPRWYIAADGLEPRVIPNTANEQLDFVLIPPKNAFDRFKHHDVADLGKAPLLVIPTPWQISAMNESNKLLIDDSWIVAGEQGLEEETIFLAGKLNLKKSVSRESQERKIIKLSLDKGKTNGAKKAASDQEFSHESYHIQVNPSMQLITIRGGGNAGVFYGIQTLLGIMSDKMVVPQLSVNDFPRFSYRGLMIDVARNFQPKNEIIKLLDIMASYKLNKFHFHLTDDEGWRLEIPGIKELTSVGSKRCHDVRESTCIFPQLGSGPDTYSSGTGYYTIEDYREILRQAERRHIEVIPEFDLPGHSHATIKSMTSRYNKFMKRGMEKEAKEFLISDFQDKSRYYSAQGFTDGAANPCLNATYSFMEHVLTQLSKLHRDIQPLTVFHFGGDEIPLQAWTKSPPCEKLAKWLDFPYNSDDTHNKLKQHFLKRLSNITAKMEIDMAGWGDFLFSRVKGEILPREFFSNKNVYSFAWSKTSAAKQNREISLMAERGYKVVLSNSDFLYFDHPSEPHGEECGNSWAASFTDSRKVFGFVPEDLYNDAGQKTFNCTGRKSCAGELQNVLGVQAALWSETVRTPKQMNEMLFPRLLAFAERAWHKAPWEEIKNYATREQEKTVDWAKFANTLGYRELIRLDKVAVPYRVPPPAGRIRGKTLEIRTAFPGLEVQYSKDKGNSWQGVKNSMEIRGKVKLRTRSADGQRFSREIEVGPPNNLKYPAQEKGR